MVDLNLLVPQVPWLALFCSVTQLKILNSYVNLKVMFKYEIEAANNKYNKIH